MSYNKHRGKFQKGKKFNKGQQQGGQRVEKGNFDELMKGFIIMTDRDREKNGVSDANNFLIPIIEDLFPDVYTVKESKGGSDKSLFKKLKMDETDANEQTNENLQNGNKNNDDTLIENNLKEEEQQNIDQPVEQEQQNEGKQEGQEILEDKQDEIEEELIQNQQQEEQEEEEEKQIEDNEEVDPYKKREELDKSQSRQEYFNKSAGERLEQELMDLKQQKDKLLFNVNTDVKCTVFLKINARLIENVDVTQVVEHLMHKVHVEKTSVTRFCHRIFPADFAFKASEENLKKYMALLIQNRIPTDAPSSWMLECKSRNNNKFTKKSILEVVTELIPKIHFVDYKNPFYTIIVDICHNLMCLSVLKNYYDYKKYSVKVNPQLNNAHDFSHSQGINHLPRKEQQPVTEEERQANELRQEEIKSHLRTEQIKANVDDEDEIDLI